MRCRSRRALAAAARGRGRAVLVREHVARVLYDDERGFFNTEGGVVGGARSRDHATQFRSMSRDDYVKRSADLQSRSQFSTPSEIFSPLYGEAVARWALSERDRGGGSAPLAVVEMGGGNGTVARDVLDFVERERPDVYRTMTYEAVDISHVLHARQREACARHEAAGRFVAHLGSMAEWAEEPRDGLHMVVGLEVLDNLPHDRVSIAPDGAVREWTVRGAREEDMREEARPASDPLVIEYLEHAQEFEEPRGGGLWGALARAMPHSVGAGADPDEVWWLPTVQLQLLKALARGFPRRRVLLADFDFLPGALPGRNGPLVAGRAPAPGVPRVDRDSVLVEPGGADVFFPTEFDCLRQLAARVGGGGGEVLTNAEFMARHADVDAAALVDGFNPLVEDFANTRFYLGWSSN